MFTIAHISSYEPNDIQHDFQSWMFKEEILWLITSDSI